MYWTPEKSKKVSFRHYHCSPKPSFVWPLTGCVGIDRNARVFVCACVCSLCKCQGGMVVSLSAEHVWQAVCKGEKLFKPLHLLLLFFLLNYPWQEWSLESEPQLRVHIGAGSVESPPGSCCGALSFIQIRFIRVWGGDVAVRYSQTTTLMIDEGLFSYTQSYSTLLLKGWDYISLSRLAQGSSCWREHRSGSPVLLSNVDLRRLFETSIRDL